MRTIHFTTRSTMALVRSELKRRFPDVDFDVAVDMPVAPFGPALTLVGLVVRWTGGPSREAVEEVVSRFQGLAWNPQTGVLEEHEHMEVTSDGVLRRLRFGVDYVFVEGTSDESDLTGGRA